MGLVSLFPSFALSSDLFAPFLAVVSYWPAFFVRDDISRTCQCFLGLWMFWVADATEYLVCNSVMDA